jgi:UDP-N-acetylmuramyl pentapeptide phosphotransferase/UDP-N-acetylglucosamine-1-phosphate transferase
MIWAGLVLVVGLAAAVTSFATGMALEFLKQKDILDHPNERSSHVVPTPRGGGLGVIPVLILAFVLIALFVADRGVLAVAALGAGALAWVSWQNDIEEIPQFIRLSLHFAVAGMALNLAPLPGLVFQGLLPSVVDLALATILWVWFINLFNFMDGIDGISGVETALIGVGLAGLAIIGGKFGFAWAGSNRRGAWFSPLELAQGENFLRRYRQHSFGLSLGLSAFGASCGWGMAGRADSAALLFGGCNFHAFAPSG